ncbi:hse1_ustma ame: full=class e vacuolar protein-sorting machinery protein hse1 [Ceraceosorus bombacis]|uniref:Class E vacuolar protein-sorting machinery protein HSE1 n=1 Tax=Ceraceosorus bombacis TaxID=401625 RepID=A0A0P1BEE0_9BASI|nr:hse1_ustma ame: full=class e vacuolar protein-sorting machinery protein hse1 [Ceraceosorus bombacis]
MSVTNPYDEIVTKATNENLTSENWELNLDVCDKVSGEGEVGARSCVHSISKRLQHRSAHVQIYALTLCDALSKNCGSIAQKELDSRTFAEALRRLIVDRNASIEVKKKSWALMKEWVAESNAETGRVLKETLDGLSAQNINYDVEPEAAPEPSSEQLRQEDEELRRVLELSKSDVGGRYGANGWFEMPGETSGASGSGSTNRAGSSRAEQSVTAAAAGEAVSSTVASTLSSRPNEPSSIASTTAEISRPDATGYIARPSAAAAQNDVRPVIQPTTAATTSAPPYASRQSTIIPPATSVAAQNQAETQQAASRPNIATSHTATAVPAAPQAQNAVPAANTTAPPAPSAVASPIANDAAATPSAPSRVRALYDFAPTEAGELAFSKGDIIRVLDSVYEHWWRGELRGNAGIFPVNYVEVLPNPTPAELQREAELEARLFAQSGSIDNLITKLNELDPDHDNLAENEELQELYQTALSLRPKIVKLIDRYSVKLAELRAMNEKFTRARGTFDTAMEQSLAKYNPGAPTSTYTEVRPEYSQQVQRQQQQQQHDYSQQWAQWYAANGYTQAQQQQQPHPNDPNYAAWYYAQQQQQQYAQAQHGVSAQTGQHQPHAHIPASLTEMQGSAPVNAPQSQPVASPQPQPQQVAGGPSAPQPPSQSPLPQPPAQSSEAPHDDEKKRLFERARAEAEAYHRAAQQHLQSQAQDSGAGPST